MPEESPTLEQDAELENQTDETVPSGRQSDRDKVIESIVAGRHQDLENDLQGNDYEHEDDDTSQKTEGKKPEEKNPDGKLKVKVNGKEYQVTPEEIKEYQKQRSADERFREIAAERQRLAAEREAFLKERETPVKEEPAQDNKQLADNIIQAVFAEDSDQLSELLNGLTASQKKDAIKEAQVAPETIDQIIDQREHKRELGRAIKRFDKDYPVLAKDFRAAVDERTVIEMEADPQASFWEIIERAANHVDQTIKSVAGPEKKQPRMPASPVRSKISARFQPAPREQRLSAFDEIKRARGQ